MRKYMSVLYRKKTGYNEKEVLENLRSPLQLIFSRLYVDYGGCMVVLKVNLASPSPSGRARSPARAGNRRFWLLSTLRAHTKVPYKIDLHRKTLIALNRPGRARTVQSESAAASTAVASRQTVHWVHSLRQDWAAARGDLPHPRVKLPQRVNCHKG